MCIRDSFGIFSNNKGKVTHTRYFNTETGGTTGYLKLNSNRIYILTSENTASSSELVISSLEPFMNIILIGELTEGKKDVYKRQVYFCRQYH